MVQNGPVLAASLAFESKLLVRIMYYVGCIGIFIFYWYWKLVLETEGE